MPAASCCTQTNLAARSGSRRQRQGCSRDTPPVPGDKGRGASPAPCPRGDGDRARGQRTACCGTWAGSSPRPRPQHRTHGTAGCDWRWRLDPCQSCPAPQGLPQAPREPAQPSPRDSPACTARGEAGEHHPLAPARARVEGHHTECWAATGLALFGVRMA